jgi:hypothetical protein
MLKRRYTQKQGLKLTKRSKTKPPHERKLKRREMMTRQEHLDWCKKRALEYSKNGDYHGAFDSLVADLGQHKETQAHPGIMNGLTLMGQGALLNKSAMDKYINDLN